MEAWGVETYQKEIKHLTQKNDEFERLFHFVVKMFCDCTGEQRMKVELADFVPAYVKNCLRALEFPEEYVTTMRYCDREKFVENKVRTTLQELCAAAPPALVVEKEDGIQGGVQPKDSVSVAPNPPPSILPKSETREVIAKSMTDLHKSLMK